MKATDIPEEQQATRPQAEHSRKPYMPEKEVLRRLWRIYEMALAAAQRAEQA